MVSHNTVLPEHASPTSRRTGLPLLPGVKSWCIARHRASGFSTRNNASKVGVADPLAIKDEMEDPMVSEIIRENVVLLMDVELFHNK